MIIHHAHINTAALQKPPAVKWDEKKWPQTAMALELVLVGWGPNMQCLPTSDWRERTKGSLTQTNWENLVHRIPRTYRHNPNNTVPPNELDLRFIPLAEFLIGSPGALLFSTNAFSAHALFYRVRGTPSMHSGPFRARPFLQWRCQIPAQRHCSA